MEVREAIRGRRSVGKVTDKPVGRDVIERLLEAASWAPNHYLSEPWRFVVMTGEGRARLGQAYAEIALQQAPDKLSGEERQAYAAKQAAKAYRSPAVIAVWAKLPEEPENARREDLASVYAAIQNLLLAAHAEGLGVKWRSGDPMYHPVMKAAFGLGQSDQMAALLYVGYPDETAKVPKKTDVREFTVWYE